MRLTPKKWKSVGEAYSLCDLQAPEKRLRRFAYISETADNVVQATCAVLQPGPPSQVDVSAVVRMGGQVWGRVSVGGEGERYFMTRREAHSRSARGRRGPARTQY